MLLKGTNSSSPNNTPSSDRQLSAFEVDRRLLALVRTHQRVEARLCFYLREMEERALYRPIGFASLCDYARERLGFEEKKTRALLRMAIQFKVLKKLGRAFAEGELPWTKVREAVKVATPETEEEWLLKCREMSNRQLEREVRKTEPPVRKKTLVFVLDGERVDAWEQVREALERLAGKTLTDIEVWDLMTAEVLATYAGTPPFGANEAEEAGGYLRLVAERDGFQCQRPGCSSRSGLTAHHIESRAKGGSDECSNLITACLPCHEALTAGRLRVRGRAPDGLTWEAPWGVIEKPLPLPTRTGGDSGRVGPERRADGKLSPFAKRIDSQDGLFVRESEGAYRTNGSGGWPVGFARRDHVIPRVPLQKLEPVAGRSQRRNRACGTFVS